MKTNKKEKAYDAVRMMREVRVKINQKTQNINFEELKAYFKAKLRDNDAKHVGQQ